jgi:hypothetical protein
MKRYLAVLGTGVLALTLGACGRNMPNQPKPSYLGTTFSEEATSDGIHRLANVFTAGGDITPTVVAFRTALGNLNANTPGSRTDGRREINWDAVPALNTNTNDFPGDFFNQPAVGRARGTVFSTPGTGFRVSDNNFADLNLDFGNQFNFFSPIRTFAAVGSSEMTVDFFVPGSTDPATSTGFGVVFSDVDREGSASIRLFDAAGKNLGRFAAPVSPSGLSFVGVTFPTAVVARVEIESGQGAVAVGATDVSDRNQGPARDLVIMDDFIYGEPQGVSAGASVAIGASTAAASRTHASLAAAGNTNGAAGQMPAFYDGELFTVNMKEMPKNASASLLGKNSGVNEIFASNDLDDEQDFVPVINAIQGDGFNPLWRQNLIVFNRGFTPHQFHSDDEVEAAAAGTNPEITIVATDEVYRCSVVGRN